MCSISASRMSSWVCGLMIEGNRLIWLGRLLVLDVAGDGARELGVDALSGARNEPGVDGMSAMYWSRSSIVISRPSSSLAVWNTCQWSATTLVSGSVIHWISTQQ